MSAQTADSAQNPAVDVLSRGAAGVSASWHAGWYWETDETHRLTRLVPGADLPTWLQVDWDVVSAAVPAPEPLWQLWASAHECDAAARLRFQMRHQQAWADALLEVGGTGPDPDALLEFSRRMHVSNFAS